MSLFHFSPFFKLNFLQVEVSTVCNLRCEMCPKNYFDWKPKSMDLDFFRKLPFGRFRYVHLQGWGEPLLNPNIGDMIEISKRKCRVGMTTNGIFIDEWKDELLKLDLLAVSIAGIDSQKRVRKCELEDVAEKIRLLASEKERPKIVIATLMMKNTIEELPKLVEIAKQIGADQVIANNLDYIPSKDLVGMEVFSENPDERYLRVISEAERRAKELGIEFVARPIKLEEAAVCAENPLKNCLVTVEGLVSPCVYLHLPTRKDYIVRFFRGEEKRVKKLYFGRADEFEMVWKSRDYSDFRKRIEMRLYSEIDLPEPCKTCYKAYSV